MALELLDTECEKENIPKYKSCGLSGSLSASPSHSHSLLCLLSGVFSIVWDYGVLSTVYLYISNISGIILKFS